jgi:hypothetical protein
LVRQLPPVTEVLTPVVVLLALAVVVAVIPAQVVVAEQGHTLAVVHRVALTGMLEPLLAKAVAVAVAVDTVYVALVAAYTSLMVAAVAVQVLPLGKEQAVLEVLQVLGLTNLGKVVLVVVAVQMRQVMLAEFPAAAAVEVAIPIPTVLVVIPGVGRGARGVVAQFASSGASAGNAEHHHFHQPMWALNFLD